MVTIPRICALALIQSVASIFILIRNLLQLTTPLSNFDELLFNSWHLRCC